MIARHRLRTSADVRRVIQRGGSVAGPGFVLYHLPRDEPEPSRFGFSVPRTVGSAVARNRVRRLLREACRALIPRIRPADVVVVVRSSGAAWGLVELDRHLSDAAARAGLTLPPHTPRPAKEGTSR